VFRVTDQLVLSVPKGSRPSAGRIEHEPSTCHSVSDLPSVPYLYFVIQGNWSGSYDPKDVPLIGGKRKFQPDTVTVRVERDPAGTSTSDEERKVHQVGLKAWNKLPDKQEIGGLTCGRPGASTHPGNKGGLLCWSHPTSSEPDTLAIRTFAYADTPFVRLDADYRSKRFGGIHLYWGVCTLDIAHSRDIDQAIGKSLTEWNLVSESATLPGQ
jgi:hypothetical protein